MASVSRGRSTLAAVQWLDEDDDDDDDVVEEEEEDCTGHGWMGLKRLRIVDRNSRVVDSSR